MTTVVKYVSDPDELAAIGRARGLDQPAKLYYVIDCQASARKLLKRIPNRDRNSKPARYVRFTGRQRRQAEQVEWLAVNLDGNSLADRCSRPSVERVRSMSSATRT
jgi:hypothetical protein